MLIDFENTYRSHSIEYGLILFEKQEEENEDEEDEEDE